MYFENDLHEEPELTFVDTEESVKKTHPEALQIEEEEGEEEKKKAPAAVVKECTEENKDESPKENEVGPDI